MVTKFAYLVFLVAIIMIISTWIQYHKRKITASWAIFWSGLWIVGTIAVFSVGILDIIGEYVIQDNGRQLVVYLCIILLFFICYRLFLAIQKLNDSVSKLVEEIAKRKK